MQYYEHPINAQLSEYIQSLWAMESENENDSYPKSQIMPDGIVEIIFHYRNPFNTYQGNTRFLQPDNFAISMMRKFVEIESTGETGFISARFFPWGPLGSLDHLAGSGGASSWRATRRALFLTARAALVTLIVARDTASMSAPTLKASRMLLPLNWAENSGRSTEKSPYGS